MGRRGEKRNLFQDGWKISHVCTRKAESERYLKIRNGKEIHGVEGNVKFKVNKAKLAKVILRGREVGRCRDEGQEW